MSEHTTSAPIPVKHSLLWLCAGASVLLHALLLAALPGWHSRAPDFSAEVISVELLAPPAPPAEPDRPLRPVLKPRPAIPVVRPAAKPVLTQASPGIAAEPVVAVAAAVPATETATESRSDADPIRSVSSAPAALAALRQADVPATPPSFDASYLRNPPPNYPVSARRKGEEGTVLLRVLVDVAGNPLKVELDRGSGHSALDGAGIEAVKRWKFVPARRGSQAVEAWVRVPLTFRLDNLS